MSSEYSISVDDWNYEKWEFVGRDLMYDYYTEHPEKAIEQGYELDENGEVKYLNELVDREFPMMLYAYPIYTSLFEYDYEEFKKRVIKLCLTTNCTVVKKIDTDEYFLALTGGGMDLSQDIALAYLIIDEVIPSALAYNVCTQYGLSVSGDSWSKIMLACKDSLESSVNYYNNKIERINEAIKEQYSGRHY